MHASYTRLFADPDGVSRFEDLTMDLAPGFAVPPAEPLYAAPFLSLGQAPGLAAHPIGRAKPPIQYHAACWSFQSWARSR